MNPRSSNYTGRFPRTLDAAFGPYARWDVRQRESFYRRHASTIWLVAFCIAEVTFGVLVMVHR